MVKQMIFSRIKSCKFIWILKIKIKSDNLQKIVFLLEWIIRKYPQFKSVLIKLIGEYDV